MATVSYQVRTAYPSNVGGTIYVDNSRSYDVGAALVSGGGTITINDTDIPLVAALDAFAPLFRVGGFPGPSASLQHFETVRIAATDTVVAGQIPVRQADGTWLAVTAPTTGFVPKATAINGAGTYTTSATPSTSTQIVASNSARVELSIYHNAAAGTVYIARGATAVVGSGDLLQPGGPPIVFYSYTGVVTAISTTASVALCYVDC